MEHEFEKKFDKCPCCGSGARFFEQMADEMKERKLAREEWNFHLDMKDGLIIDQKRAGAIPVGAEVPQYGFATDICLDCGCVYATDLIRSNSKKPAAIATPMPPLNRAQRRRGDAPPGLILPHSGN